MPLSLNDRNPDLIQRVDDAYERALTAQGELAGEVGGVALDALIAEDVAEAERGPLYGFELDFQKAAESIYITNKQIFEHVGVHTPELSEFIKAGVDFERLASAYEDMAQLELEPQLVFAPVLDPESWKAVFAGLKDNPDVNHGVRFTEHNIENWDIMQGNHHSIDINGTDWQVLVMPSTQRVPIDNIDHNGSGDGKTASPDLLQLVAKYVPPTQQSREFLHPTLPGYLTLQSARLLNHDTPIDQYADSTCWLAGSRYWGLSDRATLIYWSNGGIGINEPAMTNKGPKMGVRPPVWGEANA